MSRFKKQQRVQVIAFQSNYRLQYGTVVETDSASVRVMVDGEGKTMRFWDTELIAAPNNPSPSKELTITQAYLRELEEDAKQMMDASDLLPNGSGVQRDLRDFAGRQSKIVYLLRQCLQKDGIEVLEAEDVSK